MLADSETWLKNLEERLGHLDRVSEAANSGLLAHTCRLIMCGVDDG